MSQRIGLYAGSFDPITNGHLDIIRRASKLFDKLYVAPMTNTSKKYLFSYQEKKSFIEAEIKDLSNVSVVDGKSELSTNLARQLGAGFMVRSMRNPDDFGYESGVASEEQYNHLLEKESLIEKLMEELKTIKVNNNNVNQEILTALGKEFLEVGYYLIDLLKRPEIKINYFVEYFQNEYKKEILDIVETQIKYEGYISKTNKEVEKMLKLESKQIPEDIDYDKVKNIASEARQKLKLVRPKNIGQASRISGVNPADISILTVYLKKEYNGDKDE